MLFRSRIVSGRYISSRRPETTILKALGVTGEAKVYENGDGTISVNDLKDLNGEAKKFKEIGPLLFREVKGQDTLAGLPRVVTIRSEEIREAMHDPLDQILKAIKNTLERTPPELASDLLDTGITLAGGGALLRGIDKMLARETGLPVRKSDDPLTAVARGTGVVLDQIDQLWTVLEDGRELA